MPTVALATPTIGAECLDAEVTLDKRGPWVAHVELSGDVVPTSGEASTLTIAGVQPGEARTFVGAVRRSEPWQGRTRAVLVGGAGGLRGAIPPRDHVGNSTTVTALSVAQAIATAAGETLDDSVSAALSGLGVPSWRRAGPDALGSGGTGIEALDALTGALATITGDPSWTWRILDTGRLWIGADTYPDSDADIGNVWIDDGDDGRIDCAPPIADLRPGVTVTTDAPRQITRVVYTVNSIAARAQLFYAVAGDIASRPVPSVYEETHGATVKAQNSDGTVDVQCDDPRLGGLRKVPYRCGIAVCKALLAGGDRVRVAFEDGSPAGAYAFGANQDAGAAAGVVRVGDAGAGGTLTLATSTLLGPTGLSVLYVGPDLVPQGPFTLSLGTDTQAQIMIATKATQGSDRVFLKRAGP